MQQPAEPEKNMDYDELTLNPMLADIETEAPVADAAGGGATTETDAMDSKNTKHRRYWTPKEEERFFEIWGRENWRLTRHGKNTVFFAQWADEMRERFGNEIKPEEVQAKVNQTRAKFRQVKKALDLDPSATRWKKFDLIDKILKNQYRPKDAEPVPPEALENNRDMSSEELSLARPPTPPSITSNSTQDAIISQAGSGGSVNSMTATESQITIDPSVVANAVNVTLTDHNLSAGMFNTSNDTRANYSSELFNTEIDEVEIKREEFQPEYNAYQYQEQNHYGQQEQQPPQEQEPQLHQLQTPQQQQQLQMQQQQQQQQQAYQPPQTQYHQAVTPPVGNSVVHHAYDHSTNSYTDPAAAAANQNRSLLINSQNHYGNATTPLVSPTTANTTEAAYLLANNNPTMQPPRPAHVPGQPRKRGRPFSSSTNSHNNNNNNNNSNSSANAPAVTTSGPPAPDSLEGLYLEEVRKKNAILGEQKDISNKRLQLEERKVTLMEQFFPKCLELQEQILQKLNAP